MEAFGKVSSSLIWRVNKYLTAEKERVGERVRDPQKHTRVGDLSIQDHSSRPVLTTFSTPSRWNWIGSVGPLQCVHQRPASLLRRVKIITGCSVLLNKLDIPFRPELCKTWQKREWFGKKAVAYQKGIRQAKSGLNTKAYHFALRNLNSEPHTLFNKCSLTMQPAIYWRFIKQFSWTLCLQLQFVLNNSQLQSSAVVQCLDWQHHVHVALLYVLYWICVVKWTPI